MKKNRIKNYLIIATAILVYGTAVVAAPIATPSLELVEQVLDTEDKAIDKETYEAAAKVLRYNINVVSSQIKDYNDYQEMVNEKVIRVRKNKNLENVPEENVIKAKELIKQIPQKAKKEKVVAADASIGNLEKNEEYYKALEKLNQTLIDKQVQLTEIEKTIGIWQEIDSLIE